MTTAPGPSGTILTNIFNIFADSYRGPIPADELRARLALEMLLSDRLYVPPAVFLCNPATAVLRESSPGFLEHIVGHEHIVPVFHKGTSTFEDVHPRLRQSRSPSLDMLPTEAIKSNARFLDSCLPNTVRPSVDATRMLEAKTEVSRSFVDDLSHIMPGLRQHEELLLRLMNEEEDRTGGIEGRFWYRLGSAPGTDSLRPFARKLGEIGAMVHDYSYARVLETSLGGHSYAQSVRGIAASSKALLPQSEIRVRPDLLEPSEIDAWIFDSHVLLQLGPDEVEFLRGATVKKRREYLDACMAFHQAVQSGHGWEEDLRELKERLDEFLLALSNEIESSILDRLQLADRRVRKARSALDIVTLGETAAIMLFVGPLILATATGLGAGLLTLSSVVKVGAIVTGTRWLLAKAHKKYERDLAEAEQRKKDAAPYEIRIAAEKRSAPPDLAS